MKVNAVELRLELGEARVVLADETVDSSVARTEGRRVVLGADALAALKEPLAPLLDDLKSRAGGPVFAISVDTQKHTILAAGAHGAARLGPKEYDELAYPLGLVLVELDALLRRALSS